MRPAFSLVELLVVCTIIGVATGVAAPRVRAIMDGIAVESASRDVVNTFALARMVALRHRGAEVRIDTTGVVLAAAGRDIHTRRVAETHGVRVRSNTARVRYAATGLAFGISNGSVILARGAAADTVVISRLGRVRR